MTQKNMKLEIFDTVYDAERAQAAKYALKPDVPLALFGDVGLSDGDSSSDIVAIDRVIIGLFLPAYPDDQRAAVLRDLASNLRIVDSVGAIMIPQIGTGVDAKRGEIAIFAPNEPPITVPANAFRVMIHASKETMDALKSVGASARVYIEGWLVKSNSDITEMAAAMSDAEVAALPIRDALPGGGVRDDLKPVATLNDDTPVVIHTVVSAAEAHSAAQAIVDTMHSFEENDRYLEHAKKELDLAGLNKPGADYGDMVPRALLSLLRLFSTQGHSGFSAHTVVDLFSRLARFENLTPLTSDPDEWTDVGHEDDDRVVYQSKRRSDAFSNDGGKTYYVLAELQCEVRCEKCGSGYTSSARVGQEVGKNAKAWDPENKRPLTIPECNTLRLPPEERCSVCGGDMVLVRAGKHKVDAMHTAETKREDGTLPFGTVEKRIDEKTATEHFEDAPAQDDDMPRLN